MGVGFSKVAQPQAGLGGKLENKIKAKKLFERHFLEITSEKENPVSKISIREKERKSQN